MFSQSFAQLAASYNSQLFQIPPFKERSSQTTQSKVLQLYHCLSKWACFIFFIMLAFIWSDSVFLLSRVYIHPYPTSPKQTVSLKNRGSVLFLLPAILSTPTVLPDTQQVLPKFLIEKNERCIYERCSYIFTVFSWM